jgi:hypothetical protein
MYGDPQQLRALARRMDEVAQDVRAESRHLDGAHEVTWESTAAVLYREMLTTRAGELQQAVMDVEEVAEALRAQARAVEERLAQIAAAERWVMGMVDELRKHPGWIGGPLADWTAAKVDSLLQTAENLPAPGSQEWLTLADRLGRR